MNELNLCSTFHAQNSAQNAFQFSSKFKKTHRFKTIHIQKEGENVSNLYFIFIKQHLQFLCEEREDSTYKVIK